jgi:F420-0:gamma-glutamyl ligase
MPDATANGYPYAVPSDPLVQWPATSQSLAEKIDTEVGAAKAAGAAAQSTASTAVQGAGLKVAAGTFDTAGGTGQEYIPFPGNPFTSSPAVTVTARDASGSPVGVTILDLSPQGVRIGVWRQAGSGFAAAGAVYWIAVGS